MYELIIIGGGPAGASASVYAARKQLKTLLITKEFGGQSVVSDDIQNWIGTPHISGSDLAKSLKTHVSEYKGDFLEVIEGEGVLSVSKTAENSFSVQIESGAVYQSQALLVTAGSRRRRLEIPGAERLEHRGLTYCASCDGPMFSGQDVAVVGGGNAAFETAAQLLAYCKSVTLLNRSETFRADAITVEKLSQNPNLRIIKNVELQEVLGEKFVNGLSIVHLKEEKEEVLPVTGIFVEIGQLANGEFLRDLVAVDKIGKIIIDPWTNKTSDSRIWAAGDITNIRYHQNNIAAGEGVKALEDIYSTLKTK